jgi:hypothetical protein
MDTKSLSLVKAKRLPRMQDECAKIIMRTMFISGGWLA